MVDPSKMADFDEMVAEAEDNFLVARALAIQAYAEVERSLCWMFGFLIEVDDNVAGIIFYRMVNSRSRLAVIEDLKKLRWGDKYDAYFRSVIRALKPLDQERNQIVHWHGQPWHMPERSRGGYLRPANFSAGGDIEKWIDPEQLIEFAYKCDFYARSINMMVFTEALPIPISEDPSQYILQQPAAYPPPEGHPLFRKRRVRGNPPQSSEA